MVSISNPAAEPINLPCGLKLPNRLIKAAMAENLAVKGQPTDQLIKLYKEWGTGGWGAIMTGNVMIDPQYLGNPLDTIIPANSDAPQFKKWKTIASSIKPQGSIALMQINHPGRQSPAGAGSRGFFSKNIAPSAISLTYGTDLFSRMMVKMMWGTPAAMTETQIEEVIGKFVEAASRASEMGFDGVEIHAAHGYLLSEFLSAKANQRTDNWGGSPAKRTAIIVEIIRKTRKVLGKSFCIAVKMNSADQQNEAEFEEVMEQVALLAAEDIDFLEISGGNYEDPQMVNGNSKKSERTAKREAYFLDFAMEARRRHPNLLLMLTGGFRTRSGMSEALESGACDFIGVARPAALAADFPRIVIGIGAKDGDKVEDGMAGMQMPEVKEPWFLSWLPNKRMSAALRGGLQSQFFVEEMKKLVVGK